MIKFGRFAVAALLLCFTFLAQADPPPIPGSLKDNMHQIGVLMKQVASTADDAAEAQANSQLVLKAKAFFKLAAVQTPDSIAAMPAASRPVALADFQRLIGLEIGLCDQASTAFASGDLNTAANVLQAMAAYKKEAHDKYNPSSI
jgi:hypothetical protein